MLPQSGLLGKFPGILISFLCLCFHSAAFAEGSVELKNRDFLTAFEQLNAAGDLNKLERVLLSHFASINTGLDSSYIAQGKYQSNRVEADLTIMAKRPGQLRMTFEAEEVEHVLIGNGEDFQTSLRRDITDEMRLRERCLLVLEANLYLLYWGYEEFELLGFQLLEKAVLFADKLCYQVKNTLIDGMTVTHYLGVEHGVEFGREGRIRMADGKETVAVVKYHFNEDTGATKPQFPSGYTLTVDGEKKARADFAGLKNNRGVPNWFFELSN